MFKRTMAMSLFLTVGFLSSGCIHTQLQKNTVRQAGTLTDTYTQQVMDNLAMFVYDSGSLPQFSFPSSGSTDVTDTYSGEASAGWKREGASVLTAGTFLLSTLGLGTKGSRQAKEAWTMEPIRDPHKLALMRCAYQYAVASCGIGSTMEPCPNCKTILDNFHRHDLTGGGINAACVKNLSKEPWFGAGCKNDVPDDCGCIYVGHCCGQYVWVLTEHRDKLTQLTMAILDYAVYNPPAPVTNQVVTKINLYDDEGEITGSVTATVQVPVGEKYKIPMISNGILDLKDSKAKRFHRPMRTMDSSGTSLRALQQRLQLIR